MEIKADSYTVAEIILEIGPAMAGVVDFAPNRELLTTEGEPILNLFKKPIHN